MRARRALLADAARDQGARLLADWIGDVFTADDRGRIDAGLAENRRRGSGADRQRAAYGSGGRVEDVLAAVTEPSRA